MKRTDERDLTLTDREYWEATHDRPRSDAPCRYPSPGHIRVHLELATLFSELVASNGTRSAFEMGCGNSLWLPFLARELGCRTGGVEYSGRRAELARRNVAAAGGSAQVEVGDFLDDALLEKIAGQWDLVFSRGVVEHFRDPPHVLHKFATALSDDGVILTIVPNMCSVLGVLQKLIDRDVHRRHLEITLSKLVRDHEAAGFEVLEADVLGVLDFSMINCARFGSLARWTGRALRAVDLPLLALHRLRGQRLRSVALAAFYYVVGKRRRGVRRKLTNAT